MNPSTGTRRDVPLTAEVSPDASRLALFGFLWAFALLYHQVGYDDHLGTAADLVLAGIAMVAMVWPSTPIVLGALAVVHVAVVLRNLPSVYNHWYFAALVSIGIAVACAIAWWQDRGSGSTLRPASVARAFVPAGQWCLILLYVASGFHKLNHDFLDPAVSCAPILGGAITGTFALPQPVAIATIWLTIVLELGVPVLLMVRRFRHAGIAIGLLFHVMMALAGYPRFSATGVALLTLFLAPGTLTQLSSRGRFGRLHEIIRVRVSPTGFRLAIVLVLVAATSAGQAVASPVFLAVQLLFTLAVLVLATGHRTGTESYRRIQGPVPLSIVAPVLVFVSAISPYLGLSTSRALAMYSNLRTEGGSSNHLIVPATLQPFDFQRDLVTIVASSLPRVQQLADDRMVVPFIELRSMLSTTGGDVRDGSVSYIRNGTAHDVPSTRADVALDLPVSFFVQKFVRFRAIESSGQRRCGV